MTILELKTSIERRLGLLTNLDSEAFQIANVNILAKCIRELENFLYDEYGYNIDDLI